MYLLLPTGRQMCCAQRCGPSRANLIIAVRMTLLVAGSCDPEATVIRVEPIYRSDASRKIPTPAARFCGVSINWHSSDALKHLDLRRMFRCASVSLPVCSYLTL